MTVRLLLAKTAIPGGAIAHRTRSHPDMPPGLQLSPQILATDGDAMVHFTQLDAMVLYLRDDQGGTGSLHTDLILSYGS